MIPDGFHWNEAELGSLHELNRGLVAIIAFTRERSPMLLGSGFIIEARGSWAVAVTAAHVVEGVREVQAPPRRHVAGALPEFLPPSPPMDLRRTEVRALCLERGRPEMCRIGWVAEDADADVAVMVIQTQDPADAEYFQESFRITENVPGVGDAVAILGFADMEVVDACQDGANERFSVARRLVLRLGRVTQAHDRHSLCRGPCLETTIPVFRGMSGGPAIAYDIGGPMSPFGLVSSGQDTSADPNDRSVAGSSIIARLPVAGSGTIMRLRNVVVTRSEEE